MFVERAFYCFQIYIMMHKKATADLGKIPKMCSGFFLMASFSSVLPASWSFFWPFHHQCFQPVQKLSHHCNLLLKVLQFHFLFETIHGLFCLWYSHFTGVRTWIRSAHGFTSIFFPCVILGVQQRQFFW